MKISYDQLDNHLKNIHSVYLISGNESLFIEESLEKIRTACQQKNIAHREAFAITTTFDWSAFLLQATNFSLFSQNKLVELRFPAKLTAAMNEGLTTYLQKKSEQDIAIITCEKIDAAQQKSAWFNLINKNGLYIPIYPLTAQQFPAWIKQRLKQHGLTADEETIALLSDRTQGNLLAAKQEIEKLALAFGKHHLHFEEVLNHGAEQGQYDVFALVDSCLQKKTAQAAKIADYLQTSGTESTIVLWALCREMRQLITIMENIELQGMALASAMQKAGVWEKRKPLLQKYLQTCKLANLYQYLQKAASIDQMIKGVRPGDVWQELMGLCLDFCQ